MPPLATIKIKYLIRLAYERCACERQTSAQHRNFLDRNDFCEAAVQYAGRHVHQVPILGKDNNDWRGTISRTRIGAQG